MEAKGDQRQDPAGDGIPIEDARMRSRTPVRPQRQEEVSISADRHPADDVRQGGAEENRQEHTGEGEEAIEKRPPQRLARVAAEFNADAAKHQEPEHDHERQIEATEGRGVEEGKGKKQSAAGSEQPDFISIPYWTDRSNRLLPLLLRLGHEEVDDANTN